MEDDYGKYRRKLKLGIPAAAIANEMQRAGLDPRRIPELGPIAANNMETESSAAICGKQLLAATLNEAQPAPSRPRRWVVKTEPDL